MIYDCFPFHDELDLLEVRLHELSDVVDYFVLVECDITFQHSQKPLYFEKNKHKFQEFLPRIKHVVVRDAPTTSTYDTDTFQRDQISRGLTECNDDDIIIVSDVDEIPKPDAIIKYAQFADKPIMSLEQSLHYYYFNCWVNQRWAQAKILTYESVKKISSTHTVRATKGALLHDGGWHFSYLGDEYRIIKKLQSFTHVNFNTPKFLDPKRIRQEIDRGQDIITDRNKQFTLSPIDDSMPKYVSQNQERFSHLIRTEPFSHFEPKQNLEVSEVFCTSTKIAEVVK